MRVFRRNKTDAVKQFWSITLVFCMVCSLVLTNLSTVSGVVSPVGRKELLYTNSDIDTAGAEVTKEYEVKFLIQPDISFIDESKDEEENENAKSVFVKHGEKLKEHEIPKLQEPTGKRFKGWQSEDEVLHTIEEFMSFEITADMTLQSQFEEVDEDAEENIDEEQSNIDVTDTEEAKEEEAVDELLENEPEEEQKSNDAIEEESNESKPQEDSGLRAAPGSATPVGNWTQFRTALQTPATTDIVLTTSFSSDANLAVANHSVHIYGEGNTITFAAANHGITLAGTGAPQILKFIDFKYAKATNGAAIREAGSATSSNWEIQLEGVSGTGLTGGLIDAPYGKTVVIGEHNTLQGGAVRNFIITKDFTVEEDARLHLEITAGASYAIVAIHNIGDVEFKERSQVTILNKGTRSAAGATNNVTNLTTYSNGIAGQIGNMFLRSGSNVNVEGQNGIVSITGQYLVGSGSNPDTFAGAWKQLILEPKSILNIKSTRNNANGRALSGSIIDFDMQSESSFFISAKGAGYQSDSRNKFTMTGGAKAYVEVDHGVAFGTYENTDLSQDQKYTGSQIILDGADTSLTVMTHDDGAVGAGAGIYLKTNKGLLSVTDGAILKSDAVGESNDVALTIQGEETTLLIKDGGLVDLHRDRGNSTYAGAFRARAAGRMKVEIDNGILRAVGERGSGPVVRLYGGSNAIEVKNGGLLDIYNKGGGTNGALLYTNTRYGADSFDLNGDDSTVRIRCDTGAGITTENVTEINVGEGANFYITAAQNGSDGACFRAAGRNLRVTLDKPKYFDFTNTSGSTTSGHNLLYSGGSGSSFEVINSNLAVWKKVGSANINQLFGNPFLSWDYFDFKLTGADARIPSSTIEPGFAAAYGDTRTYARMSANNARAIVDDIRIPTDADKSIFVKILIPEGLEEPRPANDGEAHVTLRVLDKDDAVKYDNLTGSTVRNPGNIYTDVDPQGIVTIPVPGGAYLEEGDKVEIIKVWRGPLNGPAARTIVSLPADIKVKDRVTAHVKPPVALKATNIDESVKIAGDILTDATSKLSGTAASPAAGEVITLYVYKNGSLWMNGSNPVTAVIAADGTWEVIFPELLTIGDTLALALNDNHAPAQSEIKDVDWAVLADTSSNQHTIRNNGNENPAADLDFHDCTGSQIFEKRLLLTAVKAKVNLLAEHAIIKESEATAVNSVNDVIAINQAAGNPVFTNNITTTIVNEIKQPLGTDAAGAPIVSRSHDVTYYAQDALGIYKLEKTVKIIVVPDDAIIAPSKKYAIYAQDTQMSVKEASEVVDQHHLDTDYTKAVVIFPDGTIDTATIKEGASVIINTINSAAHEDEITVTYTYTLGTETQEKAVKVTVKDEYVCKIGGQGYLTLEEAVTVANQAPISVVIQMLIDEYELKKPIVIERSIMITSAFKTDVVLPYRGDNEIARILQGTDLGGATNGLITLSTTSPLISNGYLTLFRIVLDGNGSKITSEQPMIRNLSGSLRIDPSAIIENFNGKTPLISNEATYTIGNHRAIYHNGGIIRNNTIIGGNGVIFNKEDGLVELNGGIMIGNQADEAGAIYNKGELLINGGSIENNACTEVAGAGGIYQNGTMKVKGKVVIQDNKTAGISNNVYLALTSIEEPYKKHIEIVGELLQGSYLGVMTDTTPNTSDKGTLNTIIAVPIAGVANMEAFFNHDQLERATDAYEIVEDNRIGQKNNLVLQPRVNGVYFDFMKVEEQIYGPLNDGAGPKVPIVGAEFELYNCTDTGASHVHDHLVTDSSCWEVYKTVVSGADGMVDFKKIPDGEYMLVETKVPEPYILAEGQWFVQIDSQNTSDAKIVVTGHGLDWADNEISEQKSISSGLLIPEIIKQKAGLSAPMLCYASGVAGGRDAWYLPNSTGTKLSFTKISAKDAASRIPLADAMFELYKCTGQDDPSTHTHSDLAGTGSCWILVEKITSGSDGKIDFGLLADGEYMLMESRAPSGYETPLGQWHIAIIRSASEPIKITARSYKGAGNDQSGTQNNFSDAGTHSYGMPPAFVVAQSGAKKELYLPNMKIFALPFSGNVGIYMFLATGATLIALSLTGLYIKRKRSLVKVKDTIKEFQYPQ